MVAGALGACGLVREAEIMKKGYSSYYNKSQNHFVVTLTLEEVRALGGGESNAVTNRVIGITEREGYCPQGGPVITSRVPYSAWDFGGHCVRTE